MKQYAFNAILTSYISKINAMFDYLNLSGLIEL